VVAHSTERRIPDSLVRATTMSALFSPLALRDLTLGNRIVVSPMCQYSADDGCVNDWHLAHLGQLALSGAGLLFVEATAVERRGRITHGCAGLYSDANEAALLRVLEHCRRWGTAKIGIQLGHAGRKGSHQRPWEGGKPLGAHEDPWATVAASPIAVFDGAPLPHALTIDEIASVRDQFALATRRAERIGFDALELHLAHGYLLHSFLSPLANARRDGYGGSRENRMRLPLEIFAAMRAIWPEHKPLGVRVSASDWVEGGWTIDDTVALATALKALGCDWIDCSGGGISPLQKIPTAPGYQVPFAARVRKDAGIATIAIGLITEPHQAESVVASGAADLVALARAMLADSRWPWRAAEALGETVEVPAQYRRAWTGSPRTAGEPARGGT